MELKRELDGLVKEKDEIDALRTSGEKQWKTIGWQIREVKKTFGPETEDWQAADGLPTRPRVW